jgi:hypothetical protein
MNSCVSKMDSRALREDVLVGGLDDWADAGWVYQSTHLAGITDPLQRRTLSIGLIAELLVEELMIAGDVDERGHHPWPHSPGDAIAQITRTWLAEWPDNIPRPGAIVWLANTETGNRVGRAVLAREASTTDHE